MAKMKKKVRRRRILLITIAVILIGVIASNFIGGTRTPISMTAVTVEVEEMTSQTSDVALIQSDKEHVDQLTVEDIRDMVREAVSLAGGLESIVTDGDVVVLKTNFMSATELSGGMISMAMDAMGDEAESERLMSPEANGISTDWRVTKAVAELVRELNPSGKIYVMEASGSGNTELKMELLNYTHDYIPEVDEFISMDDSGINYTEDGSDDFIAVDLGEYRLYEDHTDLAHTDGVYYYDKIYYEADVLISIPVLKNHQMANITGAIKNVAIGATPPSVYGGSSGNRGAIDHSWEPLNNFIHDYYLGRPVDFVVTDGLQSIEHGPLAMGADSLESVQKNLRVILAGSDAVAVDTIHGLITGVDIAEIDYLNDLQEHGIGIADAARINVIGNRNVFDVKDLYGYPGWPYTWMNPEPRHNTYDDFDAPMIQEDNITIEDDTLYVELTFDEDVVKVEVKVDGEVIFINREAGTDISFEVTDARLSDSNLIEVLCYDIYLNTVVKEVK